MERKKYPTIATVQKSNQKIVEKETKSISLTHIIHEHSFSWHGTGNSIYRWLHFFYFGMEWEGGASSEQKKEENLHVNDDFIWLQEYT